MSDFGSIETGSSVHIRRSNGRVHKAIVTKMDVDRLAVVVEWFEEEETKGKEISIDQIFELNPEMKAVSVEEIPPPRPTITNNNNTNNTNNVIKQPQNKYTGRPNSRQRSELPVRSDRRTMVSVNRMTTKDPSPSPPPPPEPTEAPAAKPRLKPLVEENNYNSQPKPTTRSKKKNVVDEVEKLRKNREERRAAQNVERERRMQNCDPSNVNWEFHDMIREFRATLDIDPLTVCGDVYDQRICVCVRIRPLNKKEINRKEIDVTTVPTENKIMVSEPKTKVDLTKYLDNHTFRFDYTFNEYCHNEMVYWYTAKPLVECIFNGGMATCFAYGQTGSGKTHTMGGDFTAGKNQDTTKGIYALAAQDVFHLLQQPKYKSKNFSLYASFFEIYSGKVFDLLNRKSRLRVLEDGKQQVQVVGLQEKQVASIEEVLSLIADGTKCRTSGQTSANQHSSRSHAVFQLILRRDDIRKTLHGKFSLIDLAGNERGADTTSADRQTRIEGAEINKSLLALKECIRAMSQNSKHLPFRASKLTQVLRDSFIGERSRTCMIATLSPGMLSCEHTLNTLRYADRVKELVADDNNDNDRKKMNVLAGMGKTEEPSQPIQQQNYQTRPHLSPNHSDLALIGTLCENEVSREMIEVHQTVSSLQEIEEDTVECHRNFIQGLSDTLRTSTSLFDTTEDVDFNQENYIATLKSQLGAVQNLKDLLTGKLDAFEKVLVEEEKISRKNMKKSYRT